MLAATIQPIVAFMVLVSITVHGLSIPSFSLGRRVHSISHTWSRHATPDWTDQARHVDRPEDIVINRDSEMERGELPVDEKLEVESKQASADSMTKGSPSPPMKDGSLSEEKDVEAKRQDEEEEMKEENLPDGDENVSEWREGPHKIIERRAGPGEEVSTLRNFPLIRTDKFAFRSRSK